MQNRGLVDFKRVVAAVIRRSSLVRKGLRFAASRAPAAGVAGVIVHEGKVLLFEHVFWTAARWGLPGGRLKEGEDPAAGLRREVREECGLEIEVVDRLKSSAESGSTHFLCRTVTMPEWLASPASGDPHLSFEVLEARWFAPEELPKELLPSHRRAIEAALGIRDQGPGAREKQR
ncbi:MAG: NUDIX hydrolase [Thermoanaerobaculia bacterium]